MADNKKIILEIELNTKGQAKIEGLTRGFVKLETATKKATQSLREQAAEMQKTTKDGLNPMIDKTGLAGATIVELGRTISDSNYGIRGMANNFSQLSTLAITLISTTGGLTNAFKAFAQAFMGPLGIIVLFQIVIALIERFDMESSKANKAVSDLAKATSAAGSDLKILRDVMDDTNLSQEELSRAVKKANAQYKDLNLQIGENGKLTEESRKQIDLKISSLERLAKATAIQKQIEDLYGQLIKNQIEEQENLRKAEVEGLATLASLRSSTTGAAIAGMTDAFIGEKNIREKRIKNIKENAKEEKEIIEGTLKSLKDILVNEDLVDELFKVPKSGSGGKKQILKIAKEFKTIRDVFYQDIELDGEIRAVKTFKEVYKDALKELGVIAVKPAQDSMEALGREYKRVVKMNQDSLKAGLKAIKEDAKAVSGVFKATQRSLGQVNTVVMSYHNARMESLKREREYTLHSGKLTEGQKRVAIRDIERREIAAQKRKIKAERDMFTIKQSLLIAEEIMKFKFEVAERTRILGQKTAEITTEGIVQVGKAQMSAGAFAAQGGPIGLATFAVTIGGLIASILAARKKAKAQLSSLGAPSRGGAGDSGGTSFIAPDFNIVGSSATSQLSQTIADSEKSPLKAYVVTDDINNAQEFDRKVNAQASLG
jgi:hypothetical protein